MIRSRRLPAHALVLLGCLALLGVATPRAAADREHRVREGQTLGGIARRYDVSIAELARANGIRPTSTLRVGQVLVIPSGDSITARRGDTLASLAREHGVSASALARANGLRLNARLRPGQSLAMPEAEASGSESSWGRPRTPGLVTFSRLGDRARVRTRLVDSRGRARTDARRKLERLMRDDDGGTHAPNPRLLAMLTRISDHFGGRRIIIVSGYRKPGGYTRDTSRHTRGDAMDLRIEGVPITAIRDYCRTLSNMGCGYYPRSQFVHVDVRDRDTYWVDWSGPGEAPQYRRPEGASPDPEDDGGDATAASEEAGESAAATPVGDTAPP